MKNSINKEIESLEFKILDKYQQLEHLNSIISKQVDQFRKIDDERNLLIKKRKELLKQLEDENEDK